jgi:hypothetical protein
VAITIRGGAPLVVATGGNPVSGTLTGSQSPQVDDVLVIAYGNDFYLLSNMPTPSVGGSTSGVNAITNGTADSGSNAVHVKSFTKVITSSGDVTISATETGTADEEKVLAVWVLPGADTTTPTDVASNQFSTSSAATFVLPSVTTTADGDMLLTHVNTGGVTVTSGTWSGGSIVEDYDASVLGFMSYSGGHDLLGAAGSTGTRTFDPLGSEAAPWGGVLLTIKASTGAVAEASLPHRSLRGGGNRRRFRQYQPEPRRGFVVETTAGGTTFNQSLDGTITSAGALVKQDQKPLAGTATSAGALTKQTARTLTGGVTPAGALLKLVGKALSGSVSPAGAVSSSLVRLLSVAGSITPTGALTKLVAKTFTAGGTPTGALVKQDQKRFTGTITPAGAVTNIKTILLSLAGSIATAGALVKRTGKPLAGSAASAGALVKQTAKRLTGTATSSGALAVTRVVLKALAGTITPTGVLVKRTGKALGGSVSPTGALLKLLSRVLAGSIVPHGAATHFIGTPPTYGTAHAASYSVPTASPATSGAPGATPATSTVPTATGG